MGRSHRIYWRRDKYSCDAKCFLVSYENNSNMLEISPNSQTRRIGSNSSTMLVPNYISTSANKLIAIERCFKPELS